MMEWKTGCKLGVLICFGLYCIGMLTMGVMIIAAGDLMGWPEWTTFMSNFTTHLLLWLVIFAIYYYGGEE